ncbi:hypothetical protein T439DRAFT_108054 [Meredithblackwellia eburnea MCA 4105]
MWATLDGAVTAIKGPCTFFSKTKSGPKRELELNFWLENIDTAVSTATTCPTSWYFAPPANTWAANSTNRVICGPLQISTPSGEFTHLSVEGLSKIGGGTFAGYYPVGDTNAIIDFSQVAAPGSPVYREFLPSGTEQESKLKKNRFQSCHGPAMQHMSLSCSPMASVRRHAPPPCRAPWWRLQVQLVLLFRKPVLHPAVSLHPLEVQDLGGSIPKSPNLRTFSELCTTRASFV